MNSMETVTHIVTFNANMPLNREYNCDAFTTFALKVVRELLKVGRKVIVLGTSSTGPQDLNQYNRYGYVSCLQDEDFKEQEGIVELNSPLYLTHKNDTTLSQTMKSIRQEKYMKQVHCFIREQLSFPNKLIYLLHGYYEAENIHYYNDFKDPSSRFFSIHLMAMGGILNFPFQRTIFCSQSYYSLMFIEKLKNNNYYLELNQPVQTVRIHAPFFDEEDFIYSSEKENYYLYLGRIQFEKGFYYILKIALHYPNLRFKIGAPFITIEQGDKKVLCLFHDSDWSRNVKKEFPELTLLKKEETFILEHIPNVELLGYQDKKARAHLLSKAKMLIQPSLYHEPFGFNVIEAYLSGTEVLTTNFGTFIETVPKGLGLSKRCETEEEFYEQILLKENALPEQQKEASQQCYNFGLKYTTKKLAASFLTLLDEMWNLQH